MIVLAKDADAMALEVGRSSPFFLMLDAVGRHISYQHPEIR